MSYGFKKEKNNFIWVWTFLTIKMGPSWHDTSTKFTIGTAAFCHGPGGFPTRWLSGRTEERQNELQGGAQFTPHWSVWLGCSQQANQYNLESVCVCVSYLNRDGLRPLWNTRGFRVIYSPLQPIVLGRIYGESIGSIHLSSVVQD